MTKARDPDAGAGAATIWTVAFAGLACWTVHVLVEASLVPTSRHHHWVVWWMHGLTVVLALVTAAALVCSVRIARAAAAAESQDSPAGRTAFLGWFGAFANAANLVLIVVEGVYVGVLWTHA